MMVLFLQSSVFANSQLTGVLSKFVEQLGHIIINFANNYYGIWLECIIKEKEKYLTQHNYNKYSAVNHPWPGMGL